MSDGPQAMKDRIDATVHGRRPASYSKRLRMVAILLVVVGVLGIATTVSVVIEPSGTGLGDLLKEAKASVTGQVRTAEGDLVEGATVSIGSTGTSSTTGVAGLYSLEEVGTGKVELRMTASGYTTVVKVVHLKRGHYTVDFLAVPGAGEKVIEEEALSSAGDPGAGKVLMVAGLAVASALVLLGAVASFRQRGFVLALLGALAGILSWGWFAGSAISIVALVLLIPMRREFGARDKEGELPWHEPTPHDLDDVEEFEEVLEVSTMSRRGGGENGGMRPGG